MSGYQMGFGNKRKVDNADITKKPSKRVKLNHEYLSNTVDHQNTLRKIEEISAPLLTDWDSWVSATQTRNYMLNDPLCDWLDRHYYQLSRTKLTFSNSITKAINCKRSSKIGNFTQFIMSQGIEFESHVVKAIISKFGDLTISINGEFSPRSHLKIQETVDAMMKGTPFIFSGLLHNPNNKTYGIPDLIVRSDWINKLVTISPYNKKEITLPASRLRDSDGNIPNYHYVIVDIKFSTICLRADGVHILNTGSFPAYKAQLRIYTKALSFLQGYKCSKAFILGRKWTMCAKKEKLKGLGCFERLGTINYKTIDSFYADKTKHAIQWIRDVRSEEARLWNITNVPLERPELYPNMSNHHDWPWRYVKSELADEIKEISSLWMMGVKNRKYAHDKKIYKRTDTRCNPKNLGVKGIFVNRVLKELISINRPSGNRSLKIKPRIISNNINGWQAKQNLEFYIDFETTNDVITDFSDMPNVNQPSLIFMIGIGYSDQTGKWIYRDYTVDKLNTEEEYRICSMASFYIREQAMYYNVIKPKCFHWANAEVIHWNTAVKRHSPRSVKWKSDQWEWFDMLRVFRKEPIVIEGCLGFGLKAVATAFKNHGYIKSTWDTSGECCDGQDAIIGALKASKQSQEFGTSMRYTSIMKEIIRYNEMDVKVIWEIVKYLRNNHTLQT